MATQYSQQFKNDVLAFWTNNPTMPTSQICKDFGICDASLYSWRKRAREAGNATAGGSSISQGGGGISLEEHRKLASRAHQLEQENYILKRAAAYFAKEVLPKGNTLS